MPSTKPVEKPVMSAEQILSLLGAITDLHDLCLMLIGIFSGPRANEVFGFQWKSGRGDSLMPYGTAYEGQFYQERLKSKASKAPIPIPEPVRPVIEAWRTLCPDPSPEALMFPTFSGANAKDRLYQGTPGIFWSGGFVPSPASWEFRIAWSPFR